MTALLQKVFSAVEKLPESEQDWIARSVLDQMDSEQAWNEVANRHMDKMDKLEAMVLAEIETGQTRTICPRF